MISFFKKYLGSFQLQNIIFTATNSSEKDAEMLSIKKDDALFVVQLLTRVQEKSWDRLPAFIIRAASIKCEPSYKVNNLLRYKTIIGTFRNCI